MLLDRLLWMPPPTGCGRNSIYGDGDGAGYFYGATTHPGDGLGEGNGGRHGDSNCGGGDGDGWSDALDSMLGLGQCVHIVNTCGEGPLIWSLIRCY